MKTKLLGAMILSTLSMQATADKEYWIGTDGEYTRDRNGHCIRTIKWTPEAAIPGCEGGEEKAAATSTTTAATDKAADTSNSLTAAAVPVAAVAAAEAAPVETAAFSLSSGATFELGGSTLSSEGKAEIAALIAKFEGKTADSVVIEGHTDDSGDASFNQQLSEKRAEAVKAELVAQGAKAEKISTVGYGEDKPIADNATPEGRAQNRRVEIKVNGIKDKI